MALTVTAVTSGQSVGTGSNIGDQLFATKTSLQAGTGIFSISVQLTNGTAVYNRTQKLKVWYANSPLSTTTALAPQTFATGARYVEVTPTTLPGGIVARCSDRDWVAGGYLYTWVESPTLPVAASLTINLVELPLAPV